MTIPEYQDYLAYLRTLTDAQVQGCFDKETAAFKTAPDSELHWWCVDACEVEASRRLLVLDGRVS